MRPKPRALVDLPLCSPRRVGRAVLDVLEEAIAAAAIPGRVVGLLAERSLERLLLHAARQLAEAMQHVVDGLVFLAVQLEAGVGEEDAPAAAFGRERGVVKPCRPLVLI